MRVSVIIPVYNRQNLIAETLDSVFKQSVQPFEVIVVDDGSTDKSAQIAASFDSRVRVIRQENRGPAAARNRGFLHASGDFIHFMDSDDLSSLNTYECQLAALRESSADIAYGPWVKARFENNNIKTQPVVIQQLPLPKSTPMHEWVLRGWVTVFQTCLFRRELLAKAGTYREDLQTSEDTEYLYRIGSAGAKLVHTPETLVIYRVHPEGQISIANQNARKGDWLRHLAAMEAISRSDKSISRTTRTLFNLRKLDALKSLVADGDSSLKDELWSTIPASVFALHQFTCVFFRLLARMRRERYGDNYARALGVGYLAESHRQCFQQLGYNYLGYYASN